MNELLVFSMPLQAYHQYTTSTSPQKNKITQLMNSYRTTQHYNHMHVHCNCFMLLIAIAVQLPFFKLIIWLSFLLVNTVLIDNKKVTPT